MAARAMAVAVPPEIMRVAVVVASEIAAIVIPWRWPIFDACGCAADYREPTDRLLRRFPARAARD